MKHLQKKDKVGYVKDYYLPEWIITEQDTEKKFRERLRDIQQRQYNER